MNAPDNAQLHGALLQVNKYCNLACEHCSQSAPTLAAAGSSMELPTREWMLILERLKRLGIGRVRFTGGEPFLRPDIEQLCRSATRLGLTPSFVTNAQMILPKNIQWLKEAAPSSVWVSLYSYPEAAYDRVVRRRGAFQRSIAAIDALLSASIEVGVYFPLGEDNARQAGNMLRDLASRGVRSVKFLQVQQIGRGLANDLQPASEAELTQVLSEIQSISGSIPALLVKVSMRSDQVGLFRSQGYFVPPSRSCFAGLHHLWTINSSGRAVACCLMLGGLSPSLLDARSEKSLAGWSRWTTRESLELLGVDFPTKHCPAEPDSERARSEFVCPLTFAEACGGV